MSRPTLRSLGALQTRACIPASEARLAVLPVASAAPATGGIKLADFNLLFQAPNAGQAFMDAFHGAQQQRQQNALMQQQMQEHQEDRQFKRDQMQSEQRARQLQEARDQLQMTARLLDHATDPVSYQQARQAAA